MNANISPADAGAPTLTLLLRPREAAKALAVSERTLWALAERGEIPRVKIGRAVCYSIESLRAYIARREKAVQQ